MSNENRIVDNLRYCLSNYFQEFKYDEYNENAFEKWTNEDFKEILGQFCERLEESVDFADPLYLAHMVAVPTPYSLLAFYLGSLFNQNQHAYESSPATTNMELETIESICGLFEFPKGAWGHLSSGGTLANLEAAWLTRKKYKNKLKIIFASTAHISWRRICDIINVNYAVIEVNRKFQMNLECLEREIKKSQELGEHLLIVATMGTTGCGAIDPLYEICELKKKFNFSLHVDAAWGGFLKVLDNDRTLSDYAQSNLRIMKEADSITVDPHKQGYIPYGCGAVVYRDPNLRNEIMHDAPYTFILNNNLGQVTLEGSRNGGYASSCWFNFKMLPLTNEGIGRIYKRLIEQTRHLKKILEEYEFKILIEPEMNIICFYPKGEALAEINMKSEKIIHMCVIKNTRLGYPVLSKFTTDDKQFMSTMRCTINDKVLTTVRCVVSKVYWDNSEWNRICERLLEKIVSIT